MGTVYESARNYYDNVALRNNQLSGEAKQLEPWINELNPANQNYRYLSKHRKTELESRVNELIKKMEVKLHPPVPESPSEIIQKQINAVRTLIGQLPADGKAQIRAIKQMHPDLRDKIYKAAWLAAGVPQENRNGAEQTQIRRDHSLLQKRFPTFFATMEGT